MYYRLFYPPSHIYNVHSVSCMAVPDIYILHKQTKLYTYIYIKIHTISNTHIHTNNY